MPAFLSMFTKEQEILSMGITYSRITFGFSVIISLGVAYEKIFQSVGRMKTTMFCMMSGCILNIILDPIMISDSDRFPGWESGVPHGRPGLDSCLRWQRICFSHGSVLCR